MKPLPFKIISFKFTEGVCLALLLAVHPLLAETNNVAKTEDSQADTCEIHEIPSTTRKSPVKCLVYVPAKLELSEPVAMLSVFPESKEALDTAQKQWGTGDVPATDSMLVAIVGIDPALPRDSYFALFSEVMHGIKAKYEIDSDRLYLWGLGRGYRQAFHAARSLPDKFAALIGREETLYPPRGLLDFAILPVSVQIAKIKRDPATFRKNLTNIEHVAPPENATSMDSMTPDQWEEICSAVEDIEKPALEDLTRSDFRTGSLRFSKCAWTQIIDFENWNLPGGVKCEKQSDSERSMMQCKTENIRMFALQMPEDADYARIDGDRLELEPGGTATLSKSKGDWEQIEPPAVVVTRKNPDRAGPLADTLFTPFVFVFGTQSENRADLEEWARKTAEALPYNDISVLSDEDVLEDKETAENYSLICFGDKDENAVVEKLSISKLPGRKRLEKMGGDTILTCLQPSPFAIDRYVAINTSADEKAFQNPVKLKWMSDWALYSGNTGKAITLGSFDRDWETEDIPPDPWAEFQKE